MRWIFVKEMNAIDYGLEQMNKMGCDLKEMNEIDYYLKEVKRNMVIEVNNVT